MGRLTILSLMAKFCEANYGVSFPMFEKTGVAKKPVNPFYETGDPKLAGEIERLLAETGDRK